MADQELDLDLGTLQAMAETEAPPPKVVDAAPVKALGGMFSRSFDGWSIGRGWLDQIALNDDKFLNIEGYAPDLKLFDGLLDDDVAMSCFQQRRLDVISKDWEVEAGADDGQSKKAADHLREQLKSMPWDKTCDMMLHARWYGYGVGECMWEIGKDGLLRMNSIYVPNRAWFAFNNGGELVLRDPTQPEGLVAPPRKFWVARYGASHDAQHYGIGLAHWCYWPIYFKRNGLKFWALFLEKFGMPTMLGLFPQGWENDDEKLGKLLQALAAIGTDSSVIAQEGVEIKPLEGTRGGSGSSSYKEFADNMDVALTRVILSQTMTSTAGAAGLGSGQAEVQESKGLALAQSDSDLLHEGFNNGPAKWLSEWNFPGAATPRVYRKLQDDEDLDAVVERDAKLFALGWVRTEESTKELYGESYERKAVPEQLGGPPQGETIPGQQPPQKRLPAPGANPQLAFASRDPQALYISRKLLNADELLAWAKGQGFASLEPAAELHCTQLYCETPVDWFELAEKANWVSDEVKVVGGPRVVEPLGDKGVIVLQFASTDMQWRHRSLIESGASHGHPTYWPHVTFAQTAAGVDLSSVEPFTGELLFGPEIWEALDSDGRVVPQLTGVTFAADQLDAIDRLVQAIGGKAEQALTQMLVPVRDAVAGLGPKPDPEALRLAMLDALERMDTDQLALVLADPALAVRAAEIVGAGADAVA